MKVNVEACTHCGQCCLSITCGLGISIFKTEDICPALEEDEGLYYCGLIRTTDKYMTPLVGNEVWKHDILRSAIAKILQIDTGCTNGELTPQQSKPATRDLRDIFRESVEEVTKKVKPL